MSLNICCFELSEEFPRDWKRVRISHDGKRAIGVRVIDVLLYSKELLRLLNQTNPFYKMYWLLVEIQN